MKKLITYCFISIMLFSCSSEPQKSQKPKSETIGAQNLLFNEKITFYLDSTMERFNINEMDMVIKSKKSNPFIKAFFNEDFISYHAKQNKPIYFFIDTLNYENVLIFQQLPRHYSLGQDNAQAIITNIQQQLGKDFNQKGYSISRGAIKFGATQKFKYLHCLMTAEADDQIIYSNVIPFTTKTKSYIIQNYSLEKINYGYLTDQISIK